MAVISRRPEHTRSGQRFQAALVLSGPHLDNELNERPVHHCYHPTFAAVGSLWMST